MGPVVGQVQEAGGRERGKPLMRRIRVSSLEYLSIYGGALSICRVPSAWSAVLGTTTVVSSASTDGSLSFANQGSFTDPGGGAVVPPARTETGE